MNQFKNTPLETLIENLEAIQRGGGTVAYHTALSLAISEAKQLLEAEKKTIVDFGSKMQIIADVDFDGNVNYCYDPETYFNQTYNK